MARGIPRVEIAIYHVPWGWKWSVLCAGCVIAKGIAEKKSLAWGQAYAARFEFWRKETKMRKTHSWAFAEHRKVRF